MKCPKCSYTWDEPTSDLKYPLEYYWQRNPRYKGIKLGNSNRSFQNYGCFTVCLAWMANDDPLVVHEKLKKGGAYSGALIVSYAAAKVLSLEYKGVEKNVNTMPDWSPTIKEVSLGKSQHFTVRLIDKKNPLASSYGTLIFDPWTGEYKPIKYYPFRSYRLFKRK